MSQPKHYSLACIFILQNIFTEPFLYVGATVAEQVKDEEGVRYTHSLKSPPQSLQRSLHLNSVQVW